MREFRQVVMTPLLVVGLAALLLYGLGKLPAYLPGSAPAVKEYASIEEAATELGFDIAIPVYFPNYLSWPPETIKGQKKPFPKVEIVFLSADRKTEILAIYEWLSDSPEALSALWLENSSARMPINLNQNQGELIIGKTADGFTSNGAHWMVNGQHFLVVTTKPVQELLAIARSISP